MDNEADYIELVRKAQLGDEECLNRLAGLCGERLRVYVYRLTLEESLAEDIAQESIVEMFKVLGKLRRADRFWPWLYGIALNRIRHHSVAERRQKRATASARGNNSSRREEQAGLEKLVSQELKQIVSSAMGELKLRHRAVLAMRCYDEMGYPEIAEAMGCSELSARMLFFRAKKALQKALARRGLGRGSLLTALVLFGKMTAPSKAAAAGISVTASATKVGTTAGLLGVLCSKGTLVWVTVGGLAVGSVAVMSASKDNTARGLAKMPATEAYVGARVKQANVEKQECWYYFPKGAGGPLMRRIMRWDSNMEKPYCMLKENDTGNYYLDKDKGTFYIRNWRMWRSDLMVQRLPTDSTELGRFISRMEGHKEYIQPVNHDGAGLLVIASQDREGNHLKIVRHYNVLDEEYFRYNLPVGVKVVDDRDAMHRRGWTYFTIAGEIGGKEVSGVGRIPFVYATSEQYGPWLRIIVGGHLRIADDGRVAYRYDSNGHVAARYAGESFFKGLGRPWMGLHTIDTVRRDAAEEGLWFETRLKNGGNTAEVIVTGKDTKLCYTIDMARDVVESVTFSGKDNRRRATEGELRFSYLEEVDKAGGEFTEPTIRLYGQVERKKAGMLWFLELAGNY